MKRIFIAGLCLIFCTCSPITAYSRQGCCSWHGGVKQCGINGKYICKDGTESKTCKCTPIVKPTNTSSAIKLAQAQKPASTQKPKNKVFEDCVHKFLNADDTIEGDFINYCTELNSQTNALDKELTSIYTEVAEKLYKNPDLAVKLCLADDIINNSITRITETAKQKHLQFEEEGKAIRFCVCNRLKNEPKYIKIWFMPHFNTSAMSKNIALIGCFTEITDEWLKKNNK